MQFLVFILCAMCMLNSTLIITTGNHSFSSWSSFSLNLYAYLVFFLLWRYSISFQLSLCSSATLCVTRRHIIFTPVLCRVEESFILFIKMPGKYKLVCALYVVASHNRCGMSCLRRWSQRRRDILDNLAWTNWVKSLFPFCMTMTL